MRLKKNKDKKKKVDIKSILQLFPVRKYDDSVDSFILNDGSYLDFLEIQAKDRANMQDDEISYEIFSLTRFFRLYSPDCKFISMSFPISTAVQRDNIEFALSNVIDPIRQEWLLRELDELKQLEKTVVRREFYLMFFGRDKDDFIKNKENILTFVGMGRNKFAKKVDRRKKYQIMKKLSNMNSLIIPDFLETEGEYDDTEER